MAKINKTRESCEICDSHNLFKHIICRDPKLSLNPVNLTVTNKEYSSCVETVKCQKCGLIQPANHLTYKDVVNLYTQVKDLNYLSTSTTRGKSNYIQVEKFLNKLNLDNSTNILEIGSGSGGLLNLLLKKYPNSQGIEPSTSFCQFAKKEYDLELKNTGYEMYKPTKKFDVIIALDIIEHVVSPKDFLKFCIKFLKRGGFLIIGTPNIDSIASKILSKNWWHIRPPHIFYFSEKTLKLLSSNCGFDLVSKDTFSWILSVGYVLDSIQKLVFNKSLFNTNLFDRFHVKINPQDSLVFILQKPI